MLPGSCIVALVILDQDERLPLSRVVLTNLAEIQRPPHSLNHHLGAVVDATWEVPTEIDDSREDTPSLIDSHELNICIGLFVRTSSRVLMPVIVGDTITKGLPVCQSGLFDGAVRIADLLPTGDQKHPT